MHQLTVRDRFNATHALRLPDGSSEPMHGHDWRVAALVESDQLDAMGTVMDFHELERLLAGILAPLNHTCLNDHGAFTTINPSAENVAAQIAEELRPALPDRVRLVRIDIEEAPGCTASYFPDR